MSNKTPINPPNVTKSAPDPLVSEPNAARNPIRLLFALGIIGFGIFILINGIFGLLDNRSRLIAPEGSITVEIVDTPELRSLGLSGRSEIKDDAGMLFVFDDASSTNCFWMKDMNFSIDMVWLDENKKVITVEEFVEPSTFPESFCPESAAKYGLEIGANRADQLGINPGETLRF